MVGSSRQDANSVSKLILKTVDENLKSLSDMPSGVADVVSSLLKQVSVEELPVELESRAEKFRMMATYLDSLAVHARSNLHVCRMWREQQGYVQEPDDTDFPD